MMLLLAGLAAAADVRIYYNSSYASTASLTQFKNAMTEAGASVSFSSSTSWPTSSSSYSGYKLIAFVLPGASFSATQADALADYVAAGGRVVLVGEYELTAYGVCFAGYCTENDRINDLLDDMGSDMRLGESPVAYTGCDDTSDFLDDQLTDGVDSVVLTASNTISDGLDIIQYGGSTVVAADQTSSTTHARTPYDIVVIGDYHLVTTSSYGGCTNAASDGYNYSFWYNLYDGTLCQDEDGDGYTDADCGGSDCDDTETTVYPSALERCDELDNDCDGTVDEDPAFGGTSYYEDADSDGYGDASSSTVACEQPSGWSANDDDCDDSDPAIRPSASEYCDGADNDCDGSTDENSAVDVLTWYRDYDGDGYGRSTVTARACEQPSGYADNASDCDDTRASVNPAAEETCNSRDDDCDGAVDDSPTDASTWYRDADSDGYGSASTSTSSCSAVSGYVDNDDDCDDSLASVSPADPELCNDRDDDCDGSVDESTATDASTWYADSDGDSYGDPAVSQAACDKPSGYVSNAEDCDDARGLSNPAATETCNAVDDDCDGETDEEAADARSYYDDDDGDGYGDPTDVTDACSAPTGSSTDATDCDDSLASVHPGATESCNGVDDDCDGAADEAGALGESVWYTDADGDGWGDTTAVSIACDAPADGVESGGDCDDADATAWPGADEVCDGVDDDCDGSIDEGAVSAATWYADDDGDGYGDPTRSTASCSRPIDYVEDATDCDDGDEDVHPGADEWCNAVDDDCDDEVDEDAALDVSTWYADADGDGFGDPGSSDAECAAPAGHVADATDCDDGLPEVNPDATEVCNGLDDDCDGAADGADAVGAADWHPDLDLDGYGDLAGAVHQCEAPESWIADGSDCDDADAGINPGAPETCDGEDDDCDGVVDGPESEDALTWYADADGDSFGDPDSWTLECEPPTGYGPDATDCDDSRASVYPGAPESCNALDDDCDGSVDEDAGDMSTWWLDADGDGFGDPGEVTAACDLPAGYADDPDDCDDGDPESWPGAEEIAYDDIDQDCDGFDLDDLDEDGFVGEPAGGDDCDDTDASVFPGGAESADGVDDDCDGLVDDGTDAYDDDGDGITEAGGDCDDEDGAIHPGASESADTVDQDCDGVSDEGTTLYDDDGDGVTEVGGDCDDSDPAVSPSEAEVDGNGIDDDCDGTVDAGTEDADHDGYTADGGDCDPGSGDVHPGGVEVADGLDNDCNGLVDDGTTAYDDDGDGFTEAGGDCNDDDANTWPDAPEAGDGRDNDCDGVVDEGLAGSDDDGDGFTEDEGDCDDADLTVYPGAPEAQDGRDNDCDGDADETGGDTDGDGYSPDDGDCDDADGWANPGQAEMCDGSDNDCDGAIDEGCDGETPGTIDSGKAEAEPEGCGCAASPAPGLGLGLLALLAARRRR